MYTANCCAQLNQYATQKRLEKYNSVSDKELFHALYTKPDSGDVTVNSTLTAEQYIPESFGPSYLSISKTIYTWPAMEFVSQKMNPYTYDSLNDSIAKTYIKTVKARGNTVKLYKPILMGTINSLFNQPFQSNAGNSYGIYNVDPLLIEYDKSGKIISCLLRAHHLYESIGAADFMYSTVLFGAKSADVIEQRVLNSAFAETFIREL